MSNGSAAAEDRAERWCEEQITATFTGTAGHDVAKASCEELTGFTRGTFAELTNGVLIQSIAGGKSLRCKSSLFATVPGHRCIQ
jgi:hypothetical protein